MTLSASPSSKSRSVSASLPPFADPRDDERPAEEAGAQAGPFPILPKRAGQPSSLRVDVPLGGGGLCLVCRRNSVPLGYRTCQTCEDNIEEFFADGLRPPRTVSRERADELIAQGWTPIAIDDEAA